MSERRQDPTPEERSRTAIEALARSIMDEDGGSYQDALRKARINYRMSPEERRTSLGTQEPKEECNG